MPYVVCAVVDHDARRRRVPWLVFVLLYVTVARFCVLAFTPGPLRAE